MSGRAARSNAWAVALALLGVALLSFDGWRWWRRHHPIDDGGYAERADWSAPAHRCVHLFAYAFRDRNRDGRIDRDERPIAGLAVEVTKPGGGRVIVRTNADGFANLDMSAADRLAPVHVPGVYGLRVLVPPGFVVTTGNGEQAARVVSLPGAPADLVPETPWSSVGLAPVLTVSGRLRARTGDGTLGAPPSTARLVASMAGGPEQTIELSPDGAFRFAAGRGLVRLSASVGASGSALVRELEVRDAPVALAGLVLGDARVAPSGPRARVDFEDITRSSVSKVPSGVAGISWDMLHAYRAADGDGDGYANVLSSGSYVGYSSAGLPVTLSRAGGFDFGGGYFAAAHRASEGETLHVQAFRGSALVADDDIKLSAMGPVWLDAGFANVDRVVLATRHAWQFACDDLEIAARGAVPPASPRP
jgi:hypothetical protein